MPIDEPHPLAFYTRFFALAPDASFGTVVALLREPSVFYTHPPLFYLIEHAWLRWWTPTADTIAWAMRVPAAIFGVASVAAVYAATTAAFSRRAGVLAAALAAVSPLGVSLAQEARNYTLPILCVALGLWALIALVTRPPDAPPSLALWAGWTAANVAAASAHYFCLVTFAVEAGVLLGMLRGGSRIALFAAGGLGAAALAPWVPTVSLHLTHVGTAPAVTARDWIDIGYDVLKGWQAMFAGRRLEIANQSVVDLGKAISVVFCLAMLPIVVRGVRRLWRAPATARATRALVAVYTGTLLSFLLLAALSQQHVLMANRHHFPLYVPVAILVAGALATGLTRPSGIVAVAIVLAVGLANSLLVVNHLEMTKGDAGEVAAHVAHVSRPPALVAIGIAPVLPNELSIGLSWVFELSRQARVPADTTVAFIRRSTHYRFLTPSEDPQRFWQTLQRIADSTPPPPRTVWLASLGAPPDTYPERIAWPDAVNRERACLRQPPGPLDASRPRLIQFRCGADQ